LIALGKQSGSRYHQEQANQLEASYLFAARAQLRSHGGRMRKVSHPDIYPFLIDLSDPIDILVLGRVEDWRGDP
jgi:hypothetical protein